MKPISFLFIALLAALTTASAQTSDLAISFVHPTNGAAIQSPTYLQVNCTESSNTILYAEFFANGESLGVSSNTIAFPASPVINVPTYPGSIGVIFTDVFISANPGLPQATQTYFLYWTPPLGNYTLTAKVTDDQGNTATSDPINVFVISTPVVSVQASAPLASPNSPGVFTITRVGDTNQNLNVPFYLSGTAQNGVDYTYVNNSVTILAGQFSADVTINPLVFKAGNSKAVNLQLENYLIPGTGGVVPQIAYNPPFLIGSPGTATVYIKANDRNDHKPTVRITNPIHNQLFAAGTNITITADAVDRDTGVTLVEFFDRTTKLGETPATTNTLPGQHVPFVFTWTNAPAGQHLLRARATDSQGKTQVSGQVKIQVLPAR